MSTKGIHSVIAHHDNSVTKALLDLFSEIGLEPSKLRFRQKFGLEKRRQFFEKYASAKGFDPLIANNWYSQPRDKIVKYKDGLAVMAYYKFELAKALAEVFPDMVLDVYKLG